MIIKLKHNEKLDSGKLLYENGYYSESVTQFFYVMLLIAKALLLTRDYVTGKQKGIIEGIN